MPRNICLGLFVIALLASPIYIFDSGLPQPADLLVAFLVVIVVTGFIIRVPVHTDLYLIGMLFLGHVTIVNLFWWSQEKAYSFLLSPLYFAFNFGAFIVIVTFTREFRDRFVTVCRATLAVAIVCEIVAVVGLPSTGLRSLGTFNNPNQLGYWGLLVAASLLVLKRDQRLNLIDLALLGGAGLVVMHSLSKAALVAFALLLGIALVCQRPTRLVKAALVALALISTTAAIADPALIGRFFAQGVVAKVADRLDGIGQQDDDSLGGRGYDRIWREPQYLVLGAGEGAAWRFSQAANPRLDAKEIHSTLGTVLFSYGIVGFALFVFLFYLVFRPAPWTHFLYSVPVWAYGMTHQGLRFTMFWVFFALVFGMAHYVTPRPVVDDAQRRAPIIDLRAPRASLRLAAASRRR